jgi:Catechol dioxygenase N terminus
MSNTDKKQVKGYTNDEINGVDSSQLTDAAAKKWSDLPTDKDINVPQLLDLTEDNLTENVIRINSQGKANPRLNYVLSKLVRVLHDFVKDVDLQTDEWEQTWQFLTKCGQISDDTRHEFILLSDILGISALVDTITYPRAEGATESSVLGPFFDDAAHEVANGESICSENRGEVTVVRGRVTDAKTGKPIANAIIEYNPKVQC